jgi:hypothetical protein
VGVGEAMLAVTIPERPGTFIDFVETALNGHSIQVTEFKYRWVAGSMRVDAEDQVLVVGKGTRSLSWRAQDLGKGSLF